MKRREFHVEKTSENEVSELSWEILKTLAVDQKGALAAILSALSYYTHGERVEIRIGEDEWASIEVPEDVREQLKIQFGSLKVN